MMHLQGEMKALAVLIVVYTAMRVIYTISYALLLQPWRTLSFFIALLAAGGAATVLVISAARQLS